MGRYPVRSARLIAGLVASGFLGLSQDSPATRVSEDRIQEINQQIRVGGQAAVTTGLLKERALLLTDLIQRNPRAAVDSALPDDLRQNLVRSLPAAETLLEERGQWTGPFVTSVADDFAHTRSWVSRAIRIRGHVFGLYWDSPPEAGCSQLATVRGMRLGNRIAAASGEVAQDANAPCATTGDQKTAVLLINYPSTPLTSGYTASYVNNVFFGPAPSVSDYWRETSYGSTLPTNPPFSMMDHSATSTFPGQSYHRTRHALSRNRARLSRFRKQRHARSGGIPVHL
jgi:hypothetical protein